MNDIIEEFLMNPLFGMSLTILTYYLGAIISGKAKTPICNPLLLSVIMTILVLKIFHIPMEYYKNGGNVIQLLLAPATTVLAYSIYKQIDLLKEYFLPVLLGCMVGSLTALSSVLILSHMFHLDEVMIVSILPKSVTAPIAVEISSSYGGVSSITVIAVAISGITGAVLSPLFIKLLRIKNKVASGVAIGTCSHAFGTSKALEIGETEGAMSGISIGITGMLTVFIILFMK